jgi:hypothetical protein
MTEQKKEFQGFGLYQEIPSEVKVAWGARWIFPNDQLFDRQGSMGLRDADDCMTPAGRELLDWLNGGAIAKAQDKAKKLAANFQMSQRDFQTHTLYEDGKGIVIGNPRASYGYVYVAAWLKLPKKNGGAK